MAEAKTSATDASVREYIAGLTDEEQRADAATLCELMSELTGAPAKMWGASIIGFDRYHYHYASGHDGEWFRVGFAPRSKNLTLYIMSGFAEYGDLLARLGKHKTGKSCLYVRRLADVDPGALRALVEASLGYLRETYPD